MQTSTPTYTHGFELPVCPGEGGLAHVYSSLCLAITACLCLRQGEREAEKKEKERDIERGRDVGGGYVLRRDAEKRRMRREWGG